MTHKYVRTAGQRLSRSVPVYGINALVDGIRLMKEMRSGYVCPLGWRRLDKRWIRWMISSGRRDVIEPNSSDVEPSVISWSSMQPVPLLYHSVISVTDPMNDTKRVEAMREEIYG